MKKSLFAVLFLALFAISAFANKAYVTIVIPKEIKKGVEFTVQLKVSHGENTAEHFVKEVVLRAGDKELGKATFTSDKLPAGKDFTQEFKITLTDKTTIEAEAFCNKHGSAGVAMEFISPK
jgi:desulfoferrodoxin (superoxide reductase-like protein)